MFKKFVIQFLIFSFIILALSAFPAFYFLDNSQRLGILLNFLIFFVLVFISTTILVISLKKGTSKFSMNFLAAIFLKMIIAIVYFYFVFDYYKDELILFVASFFLSYLLLTIFAIIFLIKSVKQIEEAKKER